MSPLAPPDADVPSPKVILLPPKPTPKLAPPTTALAISRPILAMDIVRPVVDVDQAVENWNKFQQIKARLLVDNTDGKGDAKYSGDIALISNRKAIKKSGWRKIATVFNLSDEIVAEIREPVGRENFLWRITVRVTAPNGRSVLGVGICSTTESKEGRKFVHLENDVYTTAHTRAKNRAISDIVGGGEVSAEELE